MQEFFKKHKDQLDIVREFPFDDGAFYRAFLAQTYYYVAHTTRLAALAASRLATDREQLHLQFIRAAREEKGHHTLLINDLHALDENVADYPELAVTEAIYATQYYRISNESAISIFGQILMLEGLAALRGQELYEIVAKAHGKNASTFIQVHASEDPGHLDNVFRVVEELSSDEIGQVKRNFLRMCDLYRLFLTEIRSQSQQLALGR